MIEKSSDQLIIFARVPKLGENKTRLIPAVGATIATKVYSYLANQTVSVARQLVERGKCAATICYTGGSLTEVQFAFGKDLESWEQQGDSLGERLIHASSFAFTRGAERVLIIGTDCPYLTVGDIEGAFADLGKYEVVLGPALDGGYYLIGLTKPQPRLFEEIDWSTDRVFQQTVQRTRDSGLRLQCLRRLPDVDYPEDLLPLRQLTESGQPPLETVPGRLSIVVPAFNEAERLPATLRAAGKPNDALEIIVVDGGSHDSTVSLAEQYGCKVFTGNRGRARQMNAGAAISSGETLLFLHADTLLPSGYEHEIQRVLATPVQCGAFPLRIDAKGAGLRAIEAGIAFRSTKCQLPYGDQALFFRAVDFFGQGGFKHLAIMEDYELVSRFRRRGRIGIAQLPVTTSGRRWQSRGILKTTWINQLCIIAFRLGFSDAAIARFYYGSR
jgi:rSAM/selenodomain-associated transferase 2/rSAM/selenodomain-associated transferase 1